MNGWEVPVQWEDLHSSSFNTPTTYLVLFYFLLNGAAKNAHSDWSSHCPCCHKLCTNDFPPQCSVQYGSSGLTSKCFGYHKICMDYWIMFVHVKFRTVHVAKNHAKKDFLLVCNSGVCSFRLAFVVAMLPSNLQPKASLSPLWLSGICFFKSHVHWPWCSSFSPFLFSFFHNFNKCLCSFCHFLKDFINSLSHFLLNFHSFLHSFRCFLFNFHSFSHSFHSIGRGFIHFYLGLQFQPHPFMSTVSPSSGVPFTFHSTSLTFSS